jgi:hypothetical protein
MLNTTEAFTELEKQHQERGDDRTEIDMEANNVKQQTEVSMKILNNTSIGFIAGTIGLFGSKIVELSEANQLLCNVGMSSAMAFSLSHHPFFKSDKRLYVATYLGMLLPTAIDLTLRYGLDLPDYIVNPVTVGVSIILNVAVNAVNESEPDCCIPRERLYTQVMASSTTEVKTVVSLPYHNLENFVNDNSKTYEL